MSAVYRTPPCAAEADLFVSPDLGPRSVERLARRYCDRCPISGECYRSALRDEKASGVFGGVFFAAGVAVPPQWLGVPTDDDVSDAA